MKESPIFVRTHDLLLWLLPRTMGFPCSQRFVPARRVQDTALDFHERLLKAGLSKGAVRTECLAEADVVLAKLRSYLRLCHEPNLWCW